LNQIINFLSSYPTISHKILESRFSVLENYKNLNKQNELSELKIKIPKIMKQNINDTMYNRVKNNKNK
jgi:hypothetical protein